MKTELFRRSMDRRKFFALTGSAILPFSGCTLITGDNEDDYPGISPQLRDSYDFDASLEYVGTYFEKPQGEKQLVDRYTLTVSASGFVDAEEERMYFECEWDTEGEASGRVEYYFDNGSEWTKPGNSSEFSTVTTGNREVFSNVQLGAYRLYNQNEDATSEFSVDETGMVTLSADVQDLFFYDPFLVFVPPELPESEVQVEYEFNEGRNGYLTNSTISVDSVTTDTEDNTFTLEDVIETVNYYRLSDYEPPEVPDV